MVIKEIGIRGFKSYGNNESVLKLNTDKGELILLLGENGNGKSALLESVEYSLYNKVRSDKRKKWATLGTLPNRINGEMLVRIKFQSLGTEIEVKRGISPNTLELYENGILNDRAGKSHIDDIIEKYVGVDIETFKSFISMSINGFKNFISLSNEEKQLLLDKLFNLEVINILNGILKDLNRDNKVRQSSFDAEVRALSESIESIDQSIQKAIEKEKSNIQSEIEQLKIEMDSKKGEYQSLKEKVDKIKDKDRELISEMDSEKRQYIILQTDIKQVQRDISLYDSGKCPTCETPFDSPHFLSLKDILIEKKTSLENLKLELESNIKGIKEKQIKLEGISDKTTKMFNDITYLLKKYKSQIEKLQSKKDSSDTSSIDISEFQKSIEELSEKRAFSKDNMDVCKEKELYYKELNRVFGEEGVKKSIISGIIKPINIFIRENILKMGNLNFDVQLDETFTAEIKQLGTTIDHDSLSFGETKKINVSILVAYLKLIRTKRHINILFLDEVFSSIDIGGIDSILALLKSFANEYNINIFVVHHALLNQEMFDRIIRINKEIFSSIEEIQF